MMYLTKFLKIAIILLTPSTLVVAEDALTPCTACYTATTIKPPEVCPALCVEPSSKTTPCKVTQILTKHVPPKVLCPVPTSTISGTCNYDCYACPTKTVTSTGCYTSTVTKTTGKPIPCPLIACIPTCKTLATVTAPPSSKCFGCKTTPVVTVKVPSSCPPCNTCSTTATVTVPYYG